ncbi:MAG: hypothetical protein GXO57_05460 [Thermodesulfobacteria bacterium]|nr:hypothetical protein [Thermodesulfobacteriota bacterium]
MLRYLALFLGLLLFMAQAFVPKAVAETLVKSRSNTKLLQVDGRILFRFSQSQNEMLDKYHQTIYGDPNSGFVLRKVRVKFHGQLNDGIKYFIHIRADRKSAVELWDAYITYTLKQSPIPTEIELGMYKNPISMSYVKKGVKLWFPERPLAVNTLAPVWRDTGITVKVKPIKNVTFIASLLNGEGWTNKEKIYNKDGKYLYVFVVDAKPYVSDAISWRIRAGYECGHDTYSNLIYNKVYSAGGVKRSLIDVETQVVLKQYGTVFEGGYLYDSPDAVNNATANLGKAKGWYIQADYAVPVIKNLHLVARYSWVDPNDKADDEYDADYTSIGGYYLINGWQAAIRADYVFANERHNSIDNNLFCAEFQLLF